MRLRQLVTLTVCVHTAFTGSRMLVSLYAIHLLHASDFTVGALLSSYALLPMLIAVSAGRLVDRSGARWPLFGASAAVALGTLLPFVWPRLEVLFIASTLIGTGFMMCHVAVSQVVGGLGRAEDRAANFSWLALGFSVSSSLGPLVTGFAIDSLGYGYTFLLLFLFPLAPLIVLWRNRSPLPRAPSRQSAGGASHVMDLLRERPLRRVLVASGLLNMAWDLYTFSMPIYGSRLGLSASTIGVVMGSFALAIFAVRLLLPIVIRLVTPWRVIIAALLVAAAVYCLFPLFPNVPMLVALSCALGLGLGCSQPMVMALLYNSCPSGRQGEAVGVRTTVMNASSTTLPLASGALGSALGIRPVFWAMAAVLAAGAYFVRRHRNR
ncbi:MAG TPA: MFS transporter [Burkholderiales bacterium]|nr:MFS transporter [Burkholderiales bacterium]